MRKPYIRKKYEMTWPFGSKQATHVWSVVGADGAMHLHITETTFRNNPECHGGIEVHYRRPPDYMAGSAPSHDSCPLLGGQPCWHDGTSSWATDYWIPLWRQMMNDHEHILELLEVEYLKRFDGEYLKRFDESQDSV